MKKTAIVTGARRGIGLAIAKKLLEGGYRVVLCATTAAGAPQDRIPSMARVKRESASPSGSEPGRGR